MFQDDVIHYYYDLWNWMSNEIVIYIVKFENIDYAIK